MNQPDLAAVVARIGQMADYWEKNLPEVIRTPAVVSAIRAALEPAAQSPAGRAAEEVAKHVTRAIFALKTPSPDGSTHYQSGWDDGLEAAMDAARDAVLAVLPEPADQAAMERVRRVLETEPVVGRSALVYRGLIASALLDPEAQQPAQDEARAVRQQREGHDELRKKLVAAERIRENADFHLGQEMARRQLAEKEVARLTAELQRVAGEQHAQSKARHCACGAPIEWMDVDVAYGSGWVHSPGSDTSCLDARPA